MNHKLRYLLPCTLVIVLATIATHAATLDGYFLSDDFAVVHALYTWQQQDVLWSKVLGKFAAGLDAANAYYRPIPFITFASNWIASGVEPLAWRATSLAIHLANAALVYVLARRLAGRPGIHGPALAASALFALSPLSAEVSAWISGRYDALALTGMLVMMIGHLRARAAFDRWRALSLLGLAFALASKESAMTAPALLLLASLLAPDPARRSPRAIVADCMPALLVSAGYLLLRQGLFGSTVQIYADASPWALLANGDLLGHAFAVLTPTPLIRTVGPSISMVMALCSLVIAGLGLVYSRAARRSATLWCLPLAWMAISMAALIPHIRSWPDSGEGGRLLYASYAWYALWLAVPYSIVAGSEAGRRIQTLGLVATAALVLVTAFGQVRVLSTWAEAGHGMNAALAAIRAERAQLADDDFVLLLVPERLDTALFARNAAGGLVMPPFQPPGIFPRIVPFTPTYMDHWFERTVSLRWPQDPAAAGPEPRAATRAYCVDLRSARLRSLPLPAHDRGSALWSEQWYASVAGSPCCDDRSDLKCTAKPR